LPKNNFAEVIQQKFYEGLQFVGEVIQKVDAHLPVILNIAQPTDHTSNASGGHLETDQQAPEDLIPLTKGDTENDKSLTKSSVSKTESLLGDLPDEDELMWKRLESTLPTGAKYWQSKKLLNRTTRYQVVRITRCGKTFDSYQVVDTDIGSAETIVIANLKVKDDKKIKQPRRAIKLLSDRAYYKYVYHGFIGEDGAKHKTLYVYDGETWTPFVTKKRNLATLKTKVKKAINYVGGLFKN
jgi:hypothetical protein